MPKVVVAVSSFPIGTKMVCRSGRGDVKTRLRAASPAVLPSILMCDFAHLADEIRKLEDAGVAALHLDVMDGHFVPNLSFGIPVIEAIRKTTELPLDVHLMIERPGDWVERYRDAGADALTIHVEAVPDPRPVLDTIRSLGVLAGLSLNPPTPVSAIEASLSHCDLVLVMSVMPGFGGQQFDPVALGKLRELSARSDFDALLEVDGGINPKTIAACAQAGADLLVAGAAVTRSADYGKTLAELHTLARQGTKAGAGAAGS
jgi:ribulose-phosphate 3-epimerase